MWQKNLSIFWYFWLVEKNRLLVGVRPWPLGTSRMKKNWKLFDKCNLSTKFSFIGAFVYYLMIWKVIFDINSLYRLKCLWPKIIRFLLKHLVWLLLNNFMVIFKFPDVNLTNIEKVSLLAFYSPALTYIWYPMFSFSFRNFPGRKEIFAFFMLSKRKSFNHDKYTSTLKNGQTS